MKPLLIILAGHAPDVIRGRHGDFDYWFRLAMRVPERDVRVVDVAAGVSLPDMSTIRGAVISGSAAMVTEQLDWSERLAGWIRHAVDARLPLFGVCYGHQLMAHALGGRVGDMPQGRQMGTQELEVLDAGREDPLFSAFPPRFAVHTTHQQGVLDAPEGARVLARTAADPHHVLRYSPSAFSTQLHPEFSVTTMRAYIRLRTAALYQEGLEPAALLKAVHAAPQARRLLRHFTLQTQSDPPPPMGADA